MRFGLLGILFCALPLSAAGQTYLYNQAVLATGQAPAAVVTGDFNRDGHLDLAVVNRIDKTVSVILSKSDGTFASKVDYPVGAMPVAIVSGDFNQDGLVDLAVANSGDNTISVLLGLANGTFSAQQTYPTGATPMSIVAADLNGDKKLDVAVANQVDGTVSILLGNGDGTFAGQTTVTAATLPTGLATADFTGDGIPDLAVGTMDGTLVVLINDGHAGFTATTTNVAPSGGALIAGDLNSDGKADLVFASTTSSVLTILIGNGSGGFQASQISGATLDMFMTLGDFDGDGNVDVVAGGFGPPLALSIFLGKGDGTFQQPITIGFPQAVTGLAVGDFNHDNYLDVAGLDSVDNDVVILLGDGKGNLTSRTDVALPTLTDTNVNATASVGGSAVADVDHDGKMDVVALQYTEDATQGVNGFITVLPGNGDGTFRQAVTSPVTNFGIGQMVLEDFNSDGKLAVAISPAPTTGLFSVALGNGDGSFGAPMANPASLLGLAIQDMIGGDFNNDGKGDLAATVFDSANSSGQVYVFTSNGDGTFQPHFVDTLLPTSSSLAAGDFNHDGNLDLVAIANNGGVNPTVFVYLGKGDGTFSSATTYSTGAGVTNTVQAADFNGDGKVDITVGTDQGLYFFAGKGDGTFQPFVKTTTPFSVVTSFLGDFNGDGKPDFAALGNGNGALNLFLNNGDGTFQAPAAFEAPAFPRGAQSLGDLNGDGSFDLVQFSAADPITVSTQTLSLWKSVPTISFSAPRLDFATQAVSTSSESSSITLVNNGNAPMSISKVTASGSFGQTNTCTGKVATGQSCTVNVTFTPTIVGPVTGTLVFTDNAYPTTQALVLTGLGNPSNFSISASPSSNSISAGATATYTATLAPIDGFIGTVQLACAGAPTEAACTLSKSSVTMDGTNSVNVTVTVTTTAPTTTSLLFPPSVAPLDGMSRVSLASACFALLPIAGLLIIRRRKLAAIAAFGTIALALVACGGGGSSGGGTTPGTPSGTYSLKVTGTDGGLVHASTVTLTVQ
jgi:FG-GAP-like repeat/Abnormal spindle-like microcephaly-assoc'd, ASPM-SPD-2-Hydin